MKVSREVLLAGIRAFVRATLPYKSSDDWETAAQRHVDLPNGVMAPIHAVIVAAVEADRQAPYAPEDYPVPAQRVPDLTDLVGLAPDLTGGQDPAEYIADQYRDN